MNNPKKLPKIVYIVYRKEENHWWLDTEIDMVPFEEGDTVGVYELKETKLKAVIHELRDR